MSQLDKAKKNDVENLFGIYDKGATSEVAIIFKNTTMKSILSKANYKLDQKLLLYSILFKEDTKNLNQKNGCFRKSSLFGKDISFFGKMIQNKV